MSLFSAITGPHSGPHCGQLLCLADPRSPRGSLHSLCGPRPLPPSCYQSQRGPSRPSPPTSTSLSYTGHRSQPGTGVSGRFHKTALSSSQCHRRGTRKGCGWGSSRPHSCDQESLTSCIQWQPCYSDVFVGVFLAEPFFFSKINVNCKNKFLGSVFYFL